ncbi:MAG: hypothetical protein ABJB61_15165 [bacterium]
MLEVQTTTEGNIAGVLSLARQIRFAAVAAATATVKEAQQNVIAAIKETFITRNPWFEPANRLGIHFKPATLEDPSAELSTSAYFLIPHEEGALKSAHDGQFLAIPTEEIRPDIHQQIPRAKLPRNLQDAFIIKTARGPKLFQRINHELRMVYNLVREVKVRKQSTVIQPTIDTFQNRYLVNFKTKLQEALRTAK